MELTITKTIFIDIDELIARYKYNPKISIKSIVIDYVMELACYDPLAHLLIEKDEIKQIVKEIEKRIY